MARFRVRGRARQALPLVISLLLVALLAAGLGYGLGLFLTGALGGTPGDDEPEPDGPAQPATGDPITGGDDEPDPAPAGTPPDGADPDQSGAGDGGDEEPSTPATGDPEPGTPDDDPPVPDEPEPGEDPGSAGGTVVTAAPVTVYVVQVGVFSTVDGAEAMLADLRAAGFDGAMTGGDAYRVWTGLFSDRERGRALAEAIAGAGFENFIAEHTVGGSGVLPGGDGEAHAVLRTHLEALPDRTRRLALAVESGSGAAGLAAELRDAERELERLEPPPALEEVHQSLLRLHAQIRGLLEQAGPGVGADAHPALLAGAAEAAAEAAAILAGLPR